MADDTITEMMEIIDLNSQNISNVDYLKLCEGMKAIFTALTNKESDSDDDDNTVHNNFAFYEPHEEPLIYSMTLIRIENLSCRLYFTDNRIEWRYVGYFHFGVLYPLTETHLNTIIFEEDYTLKTYENEFNLVSTEMTFKKSTLSELLSNILKFEEVNRPNTRFADEIDYVHKYFEGFRKNGDGTLTIRWGS